MEALQFAIMDDAEERERRRSDAKREVAARLKAARVAAGYTTAEEFSSKNRIPQPTYNTHETGPRGLKTATATIYAGKLGNCDAAWLLTGNGFAPPGFGGTRHTDMFPGDNSLKPVHKQAGVNETLTNMSDYSPNRDVQREIGQEGRDLIEIWKAIAILEHRVKQLEREPDGPHKRRRSTKGAHEQSPRRRSNAS